MMFWIRSCLAPKGDAGQDLAIVQADLVNRKVLEFLKQF
jgi:hypothetical protein